MTSLNKIVDVNSISIIVNKFLKLSRGFLKLSREEAFLISAGNHNAEIIFVNLGSLSGLI